MNFVNRKSKIENADWLPDMDLNHDKQIQSLLCYRYTIGQTSGYKVEFRPAESRRLGGWTDRRTRLGFDYHHPGGMIDNSPAFQRRDCREPVLSPEGTADPPYA